MRRRGRCSKVGVNLLSFFSHHLLAAKRSHVPRSYISLQRRGLCPTSPRVLGLRQPDRVFAAAVLKRARWGPVGPILQVGDKCVFSVLEVCHTETPDQRVVEIQYSLISNLFFLLNSLLLLIFDARFLLKHIKLPKHFSYNNCMLAALHLGNLGATEGQNFEWPGPRPIATH